MTEAQRTSISSPANGMHVYQTDGTEGVFVKKSTGWQNIIDASNIGAQSVNYSNNAGTVGGLALWTGTQAQYDAITTKSSTTIYFIQ
jgi:hypothetical protein